MRYTASKFKNSWCMIIGIAPLTCTYGEVLKLDYFYAATFETILGSDYRSTYRSGAAVVKTL